MTDATISGAAFGLAPRRRFRTLRKLGKQRSFRIGAVIVASLFAAALLGPVLHPFDPTTMNIRHRFRPPSEAFLFGTDGFGRDVLSRCLYGARLSLAIGASVAVLSGMIGAVVGITAAYFRSLDVVIMRCMDGLMAFPAILLAIGVSAALGPHATSVVAALAFAYVPRTARIMRAAGLVAREQEYVDAARMSGAGALRIIGRHLLPNCMGPLIVQMTFVFAYAILAEGRDYSVQAWWIMLFPGLGISLAALGINFLGDGLRDVLDPRLKVET